MECSKSSDEIINPKMMGRASLLLWLPLAVPLAHYQPQKVDRRAAITSGVSAGLLFAASPSRSAEALPVDGAQPILPTWAIDSIGKGRAVVLPNWLPSELVAELRADCIASYADGNFKPDALASYGKKKTFDPTQDRMVMPSFYPSTGKDGPWVDFDSVGNGVARRAFASRMSDLRHSLAENLNRPTLAANGPQTHEMSYTRYGPGAALPRHTDEHHAELKKAHPVASGDENVKRVQRERCRRGTDGGHRMRPEGAMKRGALHAQ